MEGNNNDNNLQLLPLENDYPIKEEVEINDNDVIRTNSNYPPPPSIEGPLPVAQNINPVPNNNSAYPPVVLPVNQNVIQVQHQHNIEIESVPVNSQKNTHSPNSKLNKKKNNVKRESPQKIIEEMTKIAMKMIVFV